MRKLSIREQKLFCSRSENIPLASRKITAAIEKVLGVYSIIHAQHSILQASLIGEATWHY